MQRVRDSWRTAHGSSAVGALVAFFNSSETLDSDESRQEFAKVTLENLKFLYSNCDSDDPEVNATMAYNTLLIYPFTGRNIKGFCVAHSLYKRSAPTSLPSRVQSR